MNKIKVSGRVKPTIEIRDNNYAVFALHIDSPKVENIKIKLSKYSVIKCIYIGDDLDVSVLTPDHEIEVEGFLGSEKFITSTGKTVFNKVFCITDLKELNNDKEKEKE